MIRVGKITTTHGHRGAVKVFPLTDDPARFEELDHVYVVDGEKKEKLTIKSVKYQKNNLILQIREIKDMNQAETYKGKYLFIEKSSRKSLPPDRFFISDLIDMEVYDNDQWIGVITDVIQTGSNDVYVVKRDQQQKDLLIPALKKVVRRVDVSKKRMDVELLEGTFDDE